MMLKWQKEQLGWADALTEATFMQTALSSDRSPRLHDAISKVQQQIALQVEEAQLAQDLSGALSTIQEGTDFLSAKMATQAKDIQGDGSVTKEQIYI